MSYKPSIDGKTIRQRIKEYLKDHPGSTGNEIVGGLEGNPPSVKACLSSMKALKELDYEPMGERRTTGYRYFLPAPPLPPPPIRSRLQRILDEDEPMAGLMRYQEGVEGQKYLVTRRDGTVPEWPYFVLGARDPAAPETLRSYADACHLKGYDEQYVNDILTLADQFEAYQREHGESHPTTPWGGVDDPSVVARMPSGGK